MISNSVLEKLPLYIDPFINPNNKPILNRFEALSSRYGFDIVRDLKELKDNELPKILIFEEDNNDRLQSLIHEEKCFSIQIEQPNLDLFSKQGLVEESYIIKDVEEVDPLIDSLVFVIAEYYKKYEMQLYHSAEKQYEQIVNKEISFKKIELTQSHIEKLVNFDYELRTISSIENLNEKILQLNKTLKLSLLGVKSLFELLDQKITDNFFVIKRKYGDNLYFCWDNKLDTETIICFFFLKRYFELAEVKSKSKYNFKKVEKLLSRFEFPIAIFDTNEEILIHNTHFVELNMSSKMCLQYEDNDQITIDRVIYRVIKNKWDNGHSEFLFIPANEFLVTKENPSFEEMGIISSSIAHELNNPLAGISAAIDYLLIDDLDESVEEQVKEMKKGVSRCQNLVKTFLSFSNARNLPGEGDFNLQTCLNHAFELMRFRLIENNLNLKINYSMNKKLTPIFLNSNSIKLMAECRDAAERIVYRMDDYNFANRTTEKDQQAHEVMLALFNAHINK